MAATRGSAACGVKTFAAICTSGLVFLVVFSIALVLFAAITPGER